MEVHKVAENRKYTSKVQVLQSCNEALNYIQSQPSRGGKNFYKNFLTSHFKLRISLKEYLDILEQLDLKWLEELCSDTACYVKNYIQELFEYLRLPGGQQL